MMESQLCEDVCFGGEWLLSWLLKLCTFFFLFFSLVFFFLFFFFFCFPVSVCQRSHGRCYETEIAGTLGTFCVGGFSREWIWIEYVSTRTKWAHLAKVVGTRSFIQRLSHSLSLAYFFLY